MNTKEQLHQEREALIKIAEKHGAFNLRVFGSVARGEDTPESDIDFLVDYGKNTSAWFPAGLELDFENYLGRKTEIVTEKGLHPMLKAQILKEAVQL